jgi:putative flippase GtrA
MNEDRASISTLIPDTLIRRVTTFCVLRVSDLRMLLPCPFGVWCFSYLGGVFFLFIYLLSLSLSPSLSTCLAQIVDFVSYKIGNYVRK